MYFESASNTWYTFSHSQDQVVHESKSEKKFYTHYNHYSHTRNTFVSFLFTLTSSGLEVLHIVVRAILSEDIINISLNCLYWPLLGFWCP